VLQIIWVKKIPKNLKGQENLDADSAWFHHTVRGSHTEVQKHKNSEKLCLSVISSSMITQCSFFYYVVILQVGGFGVVIGVLYHKFCCNMRLTTLHPVLRGRQIQKGLSNTCNSRRSKAGELLKVAEYTRRCIAAPTLTTCHISTLFPIVGDRILV